MERQEFLDSLKTYDRILAMLKTHGYQEILETAASLAGITPEQLEQRPVGGYSKGMTSRAYRFTLLDLLQHIDQYDWLFSRLEDDQSRSVFANLVGYRILPAQSFLKAAYDGETPQYFDKNIVCCDKNEVFVDCGGFTGDTVESYIQEFRNYKRIYTYEPSAENIESLRANLAKYPNIEVRQCGVGEASNLLAMDAGRSSSSFMRGEGTADSQGIRIVSLDEDIQETITFLKMDIEGFEIPALLGAKRHIRDDFPKLAICTCHIVSDMWEIPRLIDTIHPGYRFYIRHYDFPQNWETVIYAVPPVNVQSPHIRSNRKKCVVTIPCYEGWGNAHLVKDCGVVPYLFYKNHHCDASMVGAKIDADYPNIQYVKGMKVKFLPDGSLETKVRYLEENARKIDCLMLHGPYPEYFPLLECYKRKNPQGRVSLMLDANSEWMDRIQWTDPAFRAFMDKCDVISAAVRSLQRHLNEKWPWPIEYIPSGFYNFTGQEWPFSFKQKKNVILTVGRLGTSQKATNVLLEAFVQIAGAIPEWELRLAGSIVPEFEEYLQQFREKHPEFSGRIHFLGNISERTVLYQEYAQAKIFALPSTYEGGPNVISEALTMGNAIAITRIDIYQDAIDQGRCGLASEINDVDGFADILLRLCTEKDLEKLCRHAHEYAKKVFDMETVAARLYHLIFGVEV